MAEVTIPIPVNWDKSTCEAGNLRRNSTGKIADKFINEVKLQPNYLRSSLGSCHDFCKFGSKSEFRTTEWTPMVKIISKTTLPKYEPLQKQKGLSSISMPASNLGNSIQSSRTKRVVTVNNPEGLKEKPLRRMVSLIETASDNGLNEGNDAKKDSGRTNGSKKTYLLPTDSSRSRKIDPARIAKAKEVSQAKRNKKVPSLSEPQFRSHNQKEQGISKEKSQFKSKMVIEKTEIEQQISPETIPEKILYITEMNTINIEDLSPEKRDGLQEERSSEIEDVNRNQGPIDTLQNSASLTSSSATESGKKTKGTGQDHSEHGNCSPRKLKFRKAKRNIEISSGTKSPRIRQGYNFKTSEGQSKYADEAKRNNVYKKIDTRIASNATRNELNGVVLKNQNWEEKTSVKSSYNNVIEETARKLAETRKSKVKALVGAFETVISLQDEKSAGTVV